MVALLRGVNVGGRNILPMKELVAAMGLLGLDGAKTYIQSGNIVFRATRAHGTESELRVKLEGCIEETFGLRVPVVLRTARELAEVVASNPFFARGANEEALHVAFLAVLPTASAVATLDSLRSPPDEFVVHKREIFVHCPGGLGKTKLTNAYFDRQLKTTSTVRNWRTVKTLLAMTR